MKKATVNSAYETVQLLVGLTGTLEVGVGGIESLIFKMKWKRRWTETPVN